MSEKSSSIHDKYAEALRLYAETDLTSAQIARQCEVGVAGFRAYLQRFHRDLLLAHYGMAGADKRTVIRPKRGQRPEAHAKYKKAVEACDDVAYLTYNLSEIARMFKLNPTGLANFLKLHYPEILERREKAKIRKGIYGNKKQGVRRQCEEQYAVAVKMYASTEKTIPEVAEDCNVSLGGLSQHLRFYHRKVIQKRSEEREQAKTHTRIGHVTGNGRKHVPETETVTRYQEALELYRTTCLTVKDIVQQTGVPYEGFRYYLRTWHRDLMLERRGVDSTKVDKNKIDLRQSKRYLKSTAGKYQAAIASLKDNKRPVAQVAAEFGLHSETFRMYLHEHEPELAQACGMMYTAGGKRVLRQSAEKYAEAIRLYETTTENLKSIAARLGIVYNSLGGYVRRNCPDVKQKHDELVRIESRKE